MARRSRAREVVLQLLYQDDLNPDNDLALGEEFLSERLRVRFSHGLCPCCGERLLEELDKGD